MSPDAIKTELDRITAKVARLNQHPAHNEKRITKLKRTAWALEYQLKQTEGAKEGVRA
jgi:peptidoglycan hydrolase CwlO-like protein